MESEKNGSLSVVICGDWLTEQTTKEEKWMNHNL